MYKDIHITYPKLDPKIYGIRTSAFNSAVPKLKRRTKMKTFYMVWNTSCSVGTVCHTSKQIAEKEAKRLADLFPRDTFIILKLVSQTALSHTVRLNTIAMDDVPRFKAPKKKMRPIDETGPPVADDFDLEQTKKETMYWKMSNGYFIRISKMTDRHLVNTIKMLERRAVSQHEKALRVAHQLAGSLQGDMALYCIDSEIDAMEENGPDPFEQFPIFKNLIVEQARRGL